MFQTISQYWNLIGSFTNPGKIVFSAISTAIAAFVLVIVVLILLRKFILIKRRHVILKVLAISYMILIPILTGLFAFKLGLVNGIHKDIKEHLPNYTKSIDQAFTKKIIDNLHDFFSSKKGTDLSKYSAKDMVDGISLVIYSSYKSSLDTIVSKDEGFTAKVAGFLLDILKAKGISMALEKGITKVVEKTIGLDEEVTSDAMKMKLSELLKSGLLTKVLDLQIDKFFKGIKSGIYLIFGLILLIPGIEIGIAIWFHKKDREISVPLN